MQENLSINRRERQNRISRTMDLLTPRSPNSALPPHAQKQCTQGASFELKFRGGAETPKARNRGVEGAEGVGSRRGVPFPSGDGVWGGGRAPPQKFFLFFNENNAFWCIFK